MYRIFLLAVLCCSCVELRLDEDRDGKKIYTSLERFADAGHCFAQAQKLNQQLKENANFKFNCH